MYWFSNVSEFRENAKHPWPTTANPTSRSLRARRWIYATELLACATGIALCMLAAGLVFVVLDHHFGLSAAWRWVFALAAWGTSLAWLSAFVRANRRGRLNDLYVARELEQAYPFLNNALINALQLELGESAPELPDNIRLQRLPRSLKINLKVLGLLLFCNLVYLAATVQPVLPSAARMLLPWLDVQAPGRTRIRAVTPADGALVVVDRDWLITVDSTGIEPETGSVEWRLADGAWQVSGLVRDVESGRFFCRMPPQMGRLQFRVRLGDARSKTFKVGLVREAIVEQQTVIYDYPQYLNLPQRHDIQLAIEAVTGTAIRFELETDQPLRSATLIWCGNRLPLSIKGVHVRSLAPVTVERHGDYAFEFVPDHSSGTVVTARYPVVAGRDQPPQISIVEPEDQTSLAADDVLHFLIRATDDFALRDIEFCMTVFWRDGEIVRTIPVEGNTRQLETYLELRPTEHKLLPGDRVTCCLRARDENPDGMWIYSDNITVTIVQPDPQPAVAAPASAGDAMEIADPATNEAVADFAADRETVDSATDRETADSANDQAAVDSAGDDPAADPINAEPGTLAPMMDPGAGSEELDSRLVMRVKSPVPRYWLGQLLDEYDGRLWTVSDALAQPLDLDDIDVNGAPVIRQTITVEHFISPLLFGAWQAAEVETEAAVERKGSTFVLAQDYPATPFTYTIVSYDCDAGFNAAADRRFGGWIDTASPAHYLKLPEVSERLRQLAGEITAGKESDLEKARALRDYLVNNCTYEVVADATPAGREVVDYFLFEQKKGHCEYYAGALTVLARLNHLPARVATGFSTGRYDAVTQQHEVGEDDTYAWTQIFIAGRGWMTFDGTPPVSCGDECSGDGTSCGGGCPGSAGNAAAGEVTSSGGDESSETESSPTAGQSGTGDGESSAGLSSPSEGQPGDGQSAADATGSDDSGDSDNSGGGGRIGEVSWTEQAPKEHTGDPVAQAPDGFEAPAGEQVQPRLWGPAPEDAVETMPTERIAAAAFVDAEGPAIEFPGVSIDGITMRDEQREAALEQNRVDETMSFDADEIPPDMRDLIDSFRADLDDALRP